MAQAVSPAKQAGTKKRPARGLSGRTRSGCLVLNQGASDDRREANPRQAETDDGRAIRVTLFGCYTASAAGITIDYEKRSRGSPICSLARKLVEAGHEPSAELRVYRGSTLCFNPLPLARWAGLSVSEGDDSDRAAHFIRYRPPSSARKHARSCRCRGHFTGHPASSGAEVPKEPSAALAGEAHP